MSIRAAALVLAYCAASSAPVWASEAPVGKAMTGETRTLPGGAVVTLSKDAKYELGKPIKLQLSPTGSEKTPVQVIKLLSGRISVAIPDSKKPKTAVLIQAPRKVSAVAKGGQSLVIATSDRVTVAAVKGEMLAALGNDWKTLPAGVVRSHGAGASTDQPVPVAPHLRADESLLLALTGEATTTLHAQPQDAAYRELSVYRVEGAKRIAVSHQEWHGDRQQLPDLPPGRYEVQARAVDRFGVESVLSEPLTLRVIGAVLPDGARLADGAILLGRAGRVKLIGAEGLEASYGRASLFIPVPADVGLARGDSTLLRLREPGAKAELGIRLEPRTLRAEVEIGPKSARWPTDPLQVTVKLFDHRGRPIADALKTKPQVFVNVGQVDQNWTHSGNTYTARVAPAVGSGPWVVRVEVTDDFGESAGRDFIELGSAETASTE